jgi:hypothetical protein
MKQITRAEVEQVCGGYSATDPIVEVGGPWPAPTPPYPFPYTVPSSDPPNGPPVRSVAV